MSKIYEALENEQRRRRELEKPGITAIQEPYLVEQSHTTSPEVEEEMISLFYSIGSMVATKRGKVIQFVGSVEGEGTSTLVQEFGRISAVELGKSVLLLKADSNEPADEDFDAPTTSTTPDLEGLMRNGVPLEEVFSKSGDACFFVCPISARRNTTSSVLTSPRIDGVFQKLKEHFDLILVDTPPVSQSPHALAICQKVDGVVLVIEAEKTREPVAESVKQKITKAGGNILGVVLNKRRYYIPTSIYSRL